MNRQKKRCSTTVILQRFFVWNLSDGGVARYSHKTNVSFISVGDGILDVPIRYRFINLKFGHPFFHNYPTFPLVLRVEALDYFPAFGKSFKRKCRICRAC